MRVMIKHIKIRTYGYDGDKFEVAGYQCYVEAYRHDDESVFV